MELPIHQSQSWHGREMLVVSSQRKIVFESDRRYPNIILRDEFSESCQSRVDSAVVTIRVLIHSKNGAELAKILDLGESFCLEGRFIGSIQELA